MRYYLVHRLFDDEFNGDDHSMSNIIPLSGEDGHEDLDHNELSGSIEDGGLASFVKSSRMNDNCRKLKFHL